MSKKKNVVQDVYLSVMSNSPNEHLYRTLQMLYREAYLNNIGIMHAKRKDDGETDLILVKLQPNAEGKIDSYPMAKILDAKEAMNYIAPDGKGGWIGETTPDQNNSGVGLSEADSGTDQPSN